MSAPPSRGPRATSTCSHNPGEAAITCGTLLRRSSSGRHSRMPMPLACINSICALESTSLSCRSRCMPLVMASATINAATPAVTPATEIAVTTPTTACRRLALRYRAATYSSNRIYASALNCTVILSEVWRVFATNGVEGSAVRQSTEHHKHSERHTGMCDSLSDSPRQNYSFRHAHVVVPVIGAHGNQMFACSIRYRNRNIVVLRL